MVGNVSLFILKFSMYLHYISRGKHWCMEYKSESFEESEFYIASQITKSQPVQLNDQLFPGDLDRGTPLVIKENNRNTIIGKQT